MFTEYLLLHCRLHTPLSPLPSLSIRISSIQLHLHVIDTDQIVHAIPIAAEQNTQFARSAYRLEDRTRLGPYPGGNAWGSTPGCIAPKARLERILDCDAACIVFGRIELEVGNDTVVFTHAGREGLLQVLAAEAAAVGTGVEGGSEGVFTARVSAARGGEGVGGGTNK